MKIKHLTLAFSILAGSCFAGEALVNDRASEGKAKFTHNNYVYKPQIITENGSSFFRAKGRLTLISDASFKIDPDKYYVTSVKIRSASSAPTKAILGIAPIDDQNRVISHVNRVIVPKTFTKLVKPCVPTDNTILIEDGVNWVKTHTAPAFNVKADGSDLPCFSVLNYVKIVSIEENDNGYLVTFDRPLKQNLPAGTTVRLHRYGGAYFYDVVQNLTGEWTVWRGKPRKGSTLPKSASGGRLVLICNIGYADQSVDFDELKIEEVDAPVK